MANPGVGPKFLSVNLNKSYGQSGHASSSNSNYGSGRGRTGGYAAGGGGMVVLSRPRSSHKAGPKLSVPPPVNLPSLRKEHERFDLLGSGSGSVVGVGSGSGSRPVSSATGWSKPSVVTTADRDGVDNACPPSAEDWDHRQQFVDGSTKSSTPYTPPAARLGTVGSNLSIPVQPEKTTVLRGEDFPSLRATLSTPTAPSHKQKSGLHQNQKQGLIEESSSAQRDGSHFSSDIDMRPNGQSSLPSAAAGTSSNRGDYLASGAAHPSEQARKQDDYFPGPLPLVRLSPRSDWADDERDTSHGFSERGRDHVFSKTEPYWERDFDFPRSSILPYKPGQNIINRWTRHEDDMSKTLPTEAPNADLCSSRDIRPTSREGRKGNSWRASLSKDGLNPQEVGERNISGARPTNLNHEPVKENKYMPPQFGGPSKDDYNAGTAAGRDNTFGRRDVGYGQGGRQQWDNSVESSNGRGAERNMRERNVIGPESNKNRVDSFQSSLVSKPSVSAGSRGLSGSDTSLNSGREKRSFTRVEKPYAEDWGKTGFDDFDPFTGTLMGIVKRKKDTGKQVDFHDPVRESFEAELERVQKLQEQERQRIIEEQERALELARKEEEERRRIAHEQEEHQRQMEEEAREAAWRAEQERLEAVRRAEEQKIAREEEKRRMLMEEERRKQAAKQKLLELEERIARRRAEVANADGSAVADESMSGVPRERDAYRADELSGWEDSERMVERITNSVPSDSSSLDRSFDVGSRVHYLRDGPFAVTDRGKSNSWRREINENGNNSSLFPSEQVNGHHSPRHDAFAGGRSFPRYGANGYMASRAYYRGGLSEPQPDDFPHAKARKWNISGDGDPYGRNTELDSEFHGAVADRFNEMGWNQGRSHGNLHAPYGDHAYQNSELDELYSYGRPRYSSRQPRVLPPPSLASVHRTSFRSDSELAGPSAYRDRSIQYDHASRSGLSSSIYDENQREMQEDPDVLDIQEERAKTQVQNPHMNSGLRCDSQSSLSVSSPPHSPAQLSHDDLDDTGDSPVASVPAESNEIRLSGNDPVLLGTNTGKENMMTASSSVSTGDDDEWAIENNDELQEREVYDEDEDGYDEEDEVRERDSENVELAQEFEGMNLEGKGPSVKENLVLGFDQGVEVGIPSDENERNPSNEETSYVVPQISAGSAEQSKSFLEKEDALSAQFGDASSHTIDNFSSGAIQEAQNTIQDLVTQPTNDSHASALPDLLNSANLSSVSVLSGCQPVHSSADMNSFSSSPAVLSDAASSQNQTEMPVKLQFGLFSGPSLIPSPIPAIQIGSIQMPLQLHHQVGPSLSHIHPPQPPFFQFGQLRYPSPISQGLLPLSPQSMTFSQPNVPVSYPLNQKSGVPLSGQTSQDGSAHSFIKDDTFLFRMDSQNQDPPMSSASQVIFSKEASVVKKNRGTENNANLLLQSSELESSTCLYRPRLEPTSQAESEGSRCNAVMNSTCASIGQASKGQLQCGQSPGIRGRKVAFTSQNHTQKLPFAVGDASRSDANGFQRRPRRGVQRMEFRVRKGADRRQSSGSAAVDQSITDLKSNNNRKGSRTFTRSGLQKGALLSRTTQTAESGNLSSDQGDSQGTNYETKTDKANGKETPSSGLDTSHLAEGRLKRNISSEEDVDAPLQSGIVRIFNQPGIEAPSDEDDFIEVRSKRQMLNDRREQREKEKAKSNNKKAMRKPRSTSQGTATARTIVKASISSNGEASNSIYADAAQNRGLMNDEVAVGSGMVSQPLAPIGTSPVNAASPASAHSQSQINKTLQSSSPPTVSSSGQTVGLDLDLESKKKHLNSAQTSRGSWDSAQVNQEVLPLTQTQFDEAMKPGRFDMHSSSVGDHIKSISELGRSTSPIHLKDTSFSSATSPINSLLAGEKIQFGAVTSPTVLPPSSRAGPHSIRSPGSRSDLQISRNATATENDCSLLFEKEKRLEGSCIHLEDCEAEAEAEAAASAVAVAAISNDEAVGNGLGTGPVSMSDTKGFRGADVDGLAVSGIARDHQPTSESKAEEILNVSLPADLSVETPPISLWPPLPSPHSSSSHMLSPFPGATPSHFPFYDMNPMLGGPIFAFGPQEESAGSQSQPQKSSTSGSGPLGTWQPCHSGVDSFYGPPAGFTGPFINPPGSIPAGVQGSPHMVVYNHFAPVGRFGQVGLSYMGTYISSTKQPDWKHNPASTSASADGDMKNLDMVSAQHNPPSIPQAQHLAPGSPLLSMASPPVAMFDVSPFQSSAELPVQARWSHVPGPPPLHSIPQSMLVPQHAGDAVPPQLSHGPTDNHSLPASRFSKVQAQSQAENMVAGVTDATAPQKLEKLEPVEPRNSNGRETSAYGSSNKSFPDKAAVPDSSISDANKKTMQRTSSELKIQGSEQKSSGQQQQPNHSSTCNYHRGGGGSQRNGSGAEWSNRRMGFHGRNSSGSGGRGFPHPKMKQIYVAKQSSGGNSTVA